LDRGDPEFITQTGTFDDQSQFFGIISLTANPYIDWVNQVVKYYNPAIQIHGIIHTK